MLLTFVQFLFSDALYLTFVKFHVLKLDKCITNAFITDCAVLSGPATNELQLRIVTKNVGGGVV